MCKILSSSQICQKTWKYFSFSSLVAFSFERLIKDFFHHTRKKTRSKKIFFTSAVIYKWEKSKFNSYENDFHVGVCRRTYTQAFLNISLKYFSQKRADSFTQDNFQFNQFLSLFSFHRFDLENFRWKLKINAIESSWNFLQPSTGELITQVVQSPSKFFHFIHLCYGVRIA